MSYWKQVFQPIILNELKIRGDISRNALCDLWDIHPVALSRLYNEEQKQYFTANTSKDIEEGLSLPAGWLARLWGICHNPTVTTEEVVLFLNESGYPATEDNFETGTWAGLRKITGKGALTLPAVKASGIGKAPLKPHHSGIDKAYEIPSFAKVPLITSLEERKSPNKFIYVPGGVALQGGKVFIIELKEQYMTENIRIFPGQAVMVKEEMVPEKGDLVVAKVDERFFLGNYAKYGDTVVIRNETAGEASSDKCIIDIIGTVSAWFGSRYQEDFQIVEE